MESSKLESESGDIVVSDEYDDNNGNSFTAEAVDKANVNEFEGEQFEDNTYIRERFDYDETGGCRPCCSCPHGMKAILVALLVTIAWGFGISAVGDCHFLTPQEYLYCHPAPEPASLYGSCGDCHCINKDKPCPSDPKEIPLTNVPDDWLAQLKSLKATNPYKMTCNPYNNTDKKCTDPPMLDEQIDLWETAPCGIIYNMSSLDEDQCPTEYTMKTYNSEQEMLDAGAEMTHWGACGACSTVRDMAVYLEYPDLTGKGQECGLRGLADANDGVACFQEVGYTYDCAVMWMYNVFNTRDHCIGICVDFTFFGDGANNGPAPDCKIADCLLCDEQMSGPYFQEVAARSRRRSGFLSKIVRACDNLLIVDHKPPCNVTRDKLAAESGRALQSSERPPDLEKWRAPEPTDTCVYISTPLGLASYEEKEENLFLLPKFLLGKDDQDKLSLYNSCSSYEFGDVHSGFWANQREIFGTAYNFAFVVGVMSNFVGFASLLITWISSCCMAVRKRIWNILTIFCIFSGTCMFLTLVFFASDICNEGCEFGRSAGYAIICGVLWWITAFFCYGVGAIDPTVPKAYCCLCPKILEPGKFTNGPYKALPVNEPVVREITVIETTNEDGSTVVEKITTEPNGVKLVERTLVKNDQVNPTLN